jgi:hypothetical protein
MFIMWGLGRDGPMIGDMDAGAERAKIDDETGNHHTGNDLGEPDMTSISFRDQYML